MQLQIAAATESEIRVKLKSSSNEKLETIAVSKATTTQSNEVESVPTEKIRKYESSRLSVQQDKKGVSKGKNSSAVVAPPGKILSQLKTGHPLKGVVASSTAYAAFISAKVFRAGKGGSFTEVNGMLHKSDISPELLSSLKKKQKTSIKNSKGKDSQGELLEKGTELDVYVKEVYKNSG